MTANLSTKSLVAILLFSAVTLGLPEIGWGQKPPPPVPPNPQAPVLAIPFPAGMQRGTALELSLTGTNLAGPSGVLAAFPATVDIPTENKNGQDNAKLLVQLKVPADAPVGFHSLRLATSRGMSNVRLFCIDDLPQVVEVDTNRNKATPQAVLIPCVVAGKVDAEQGDYYKVSVQAGQRVSFDVLGRRLGGPIDPQLSLYSAKTGRELAHDNDAPGCQTDPRLTYVFKEAGDYLIEIKDVLFRGGADFVYRLRIGDFPCATVPIPLAGKRGSKVTVNFAGPQVEGVAPVVVNVPDDPTVQTLWVTPKAANGLSGWPVALTVSDMDETVEQEPNNEPAKAQRLAVPGAVTGRFQQSDDSDHYLFAAKKGQKILIDAQTLELHSPSLVYMAIKNAKTNAELAKTNPQTPPPADQRIDFTAPEDADYLVEVQHLNYLGGPSEAYRLVLTPSGSGFDLSLGIDRYDVAPNSFAALNVLVNRRGYTGPIDLSLVGPMGLTGSATIKANQASGVLLVNAKGDMPMGAYPVTVVGKASIDGNVVSQLANVRGPVSQSLAGLPFPPRHLHTQVALAVKEKAPFMLAASFEHPQSVPGLPINVTITATRDPGFEEEITLNPVAGLPPTEKPPALKPIAKGQKEIKYQMTLSAKVPLGEHLLFFSGKTKFQNKELSAGALPATLVLGLPFDLKVEPLKLAAGSKEGGKLKVIAVRKGGYQGPIAVEVRNLPANVTAAKGMIAMSQDSTEIVVTAAANAPAGPKMDVNVLGTATAAANLQNASPNFTVTVEKK